MTTTTVVAEIPMWDFPSALEVVAIDSADRMDVAPWGATHTVVMDRPMDLRMDTAALGPSIRNSRCTRCLCIPRDSIRYRSTAAGIVDVMDIIIAIDGLAELTGKGERLQGRQSGNVMLTMERQPRKLKTAVAMACRCCPLSLTPIIASSTSHPDSE